MGWEIYPDGLMCILQKVAKYRKNIFITENGIATRNEELRVRFLKDHLTIIEASLKRKLPLKGYFYWSLIDNYEWLEGLDAKFGLVGVDFEKNYQRTPKKSLSYLREYIQNAKTL